MEIIDEVIDKAITNNDANELANFIYNNQNHFEILLRNMTDEDLLVRFDQEFQDFMKGYNSEHFFRAAREVNKRDLKVGIIKNRLN